MAQFVQITKVSHTVLRTKDMKSCESQARSPSRRLTDKSEQNITTNLSHWNPREKYPGPRGFLLILSFFI